MYLYIALKRDSKGKEWEWTTTNGVAIVGRSDHSKEKKPWINVKNRYKNEAQRLRATTFSIAILKKFKIALKIIL